MSILANKTYYFRFFSEIAFIRLREKFTSILVTPINSSFARVKNVKDVRSNCHFGENDS